MPPNLPELRPTCFVKCRLTLQGSYGQTKSSLMPDALTSNCLVSKVPAPVPYLQGNLKNHFLTAL
jgi:hypothetical protein